MPVELKTISPTDYLVRRYHPAQYARETFTPSTYARKYSGINSYPRQDATTPFTNYAIRREASTPPTGYEVIRNIRDTPRSSMSRDRTSLSSDRTMSARTYGNFINTPPIDKLMKQARIRMQIQSHRFSYS